MGFGVEITGIMTTGLIRCDQPRILYLEERGARLVESMSADLLADVMAKVIILFE